MARRIDALGRLKTIGPVFRSKEAINSGVSWRDLYALRDDGEIIELSRGLFQLAVAAGSDNVDFVAVCARAPRGMICLNSALAYWDLTDEIPIEVHLAVPEGSHRPTIDHPPTKVHVFAARTFELGRFEVRVESRERFWISDRERTVVDTFRLRHILGDDVAHAALRRYLAYRPKLPRLSEFARAFRVGRSITQTVQVLRA